MVMGLGPDPLLVQLAEEVFRELERTPGVEGLAFIGALARNMYAAPRATWTYRYDSKMRRRINE